MEAPVLQAAWDALWPDLEKGGTVYVIGGTDRGKSTFCHAMRMKAAHRMRTAYLDIDTGQSTVGPPATIGLALFPVGSIEPEAVHLRFVGSTSPRGHFMQFLTGAHRLRERAREAGAELIFADSPGYVFGAAAEEFHVQMIDLLQPDHLVAFQVNHELEAILTVFHRHPAIAIHRLPVPPEARVRSGMTRQRFREQRFREYFAAAIHHELPFAGLGIHGNLPESMSRTAWEHVLIALCDADQFVLALGIVEEIDLTSQILRFTGPPLDPSRVASIHVGSLRLDFLRQELGRDGPPYPRG